MPELHRLIAGCVFFVAAFAAGYIGWLSQRYTDFWGWWLTVAIVFMFAGALIMVPDFWAPGAR